ncbi:hypothetical protein [Rhodopirellula bahusiensis]|uniref:hypothetical protein n=1 Tax=Rhodopirellula bahusiensis TaxID=2014065 RepID=UPI003265B456
MPPTRDHAEFILQLMDLIQSSPRAALLVFLLSFSKPTGELMKPLQATDDTAIGQAANFAAGKRLRSSHRRQDKSKLPTSFAIDVHFATQIRSCVLRI